MLSGKLLMGVSVDKFASKNGFLWRKSAAQSARIASFRPLAVMSSLGRHLGAFSLKDKAPTGDESAYLSYHLCAE